MAVDEENVLRYVKIYIALALIQFFTSVIHSFSFGGIMYYPNLSKTLPNFKSSTVRTCKLTDLCFNSVNGIKRKKIFWWDWKSIFSYLHRFQELCLLSMWLTYDWLYILNHKNNNKTLPKLHIYKIEKCYHWSKFKHCSFLCNKI